MAKVQCPYCYGSGCDGCGESGHLETSRMTSADKDYYDHINETGGYAPATKQPSRLASEAEAIERLADSNEVRMTPKLFGHPLTKIRDDSWTLDLGREKVYAFEEHGCYVAQWGSKDAFEEYYPLPHLTVESEISLEDALLKLEVELTRLASRLTVLGIGS